MAKAIRFTYDDVPYVLTYTRNTVKEMESRGFRIQKVMDMPMTYIPMLFKGAFLANHRKTKDSVINEIYEAMPNKDDLMDALATIYDDTLSTLMDEPENPNVNWTLS